MKSVPTSEMIITVMFGTFNNKRRLRQGVEVIYFSFNDLIDIYILLEDLFNICYFGAK